MTDTGRDVARIEAELREAVANATAGPWEVPEDDDYFVYADGLLVADFDPVSSHPGVDVMRRDNNARATITLRNNALTIIDHHAARADRAEAENARLREALREIAEIGYSGAPDIPMRHIARAALSEPANEGEKL